MKRSFAFFALVCAILFGCVATAGAQSKALKKDVKKRVKELKKEGWKPLASSSTLEYAFSKYRTYLEEDSENRIELLGIAIGKNVKIGRENAIMNGITSYASRAKAQVVGKMTNCFSLTIGILRSKASVTSSTPFNTNNLEISITVPPPTAITRSKPTPFTSFRIVFIILSDGSPKPNFSCIMK